MIDETGTAAPAFGEVLFTKLFAPRPQATQIQRSRLVEALTDHRDRPVALLCAPAGFGKTSLLSQWIEDLGEPVAWLSLDTGDNDPVRFWRHLLTTIDQALPGVNTSAEVLGPGTPSSLEYAVTALLNVIAARPDHSLTAVLDDYHVIQSPIVHDAVRTLLDHLPPNFHIVLASRADPPLPLAGLRAGGRLAELRADDLRLDTDEAAQLLASVAGHPVDETVAAALVGRTEGWAAGLHLAALSLRQHPDPSSFVERFCGTHRYILDYLTEEVLDHQPREIRQFLLDTCVLDRLSGPVCDAIRGATDSQQTLEQIEQSGLFLVPLDSNREWWRYHGLFADLLRSRLKYNDPDRFRRLHLAAAAWHDEQRLADDSIRHALAADDPELAAELAERYFDDFILSSEGATAERWASSLPDEVVHRRPGLLLGRARIDMYAGRLDEAERGLDAAEHALPWLTDEGYRPPSNGGRTQFGNVEAAIVGTRMVIANLRGRPDEAMGYAERARRGLTDDDWLIRAGIEQQVGMAWFLRGQLPEAERAMRTGLDRWRRHGQHDYPAWMAYYLGRLYYVQGELDRAAATYTEVEKLDGSSPGVCSCTVTHADCRPALGAAHVGLAQVAYQWNELELARSHALPAVDLSRRFLPAQPLANALATLAWIDQAQGEAESATETMEEALQVADPPRSDISNPVAVESARLRLAQGDVDAADRWVTERGLSFVDEPSYPQEPSHLLLARLGIVQGEAEATLELLHRLEEKATTQGRIASLIEIRTLIALAQAARSDAAAVATLADALSLAHSHGFVRTIVDEGAPMAELLGEFIRLRKEDGLVPLSYLNHLVSALQTELAYIPQTERVTIPGLVVPLTEREMEVLALLAAGKRNQEIAEEIYVSLNTTKKHVTHILDKLGASNRTEAVNRSRELGLIP